jgi:hypothetical protein
MSPVSEDANVVAHVLSHLATDRDSLRSAMLVNTLWSNMARPYLWSSPSLKALANVPAERRYFYAALATSIVLTRDDKIVVSAILKRLEFPRLLMLVLHDARPEVAMNWHCFYLQYLYIHDKAQTPAVKAALKPLMTSAKCLETVRLSCPLAFLDLAQLASLPRLRHLELKGPLPTPEEIRAVPQRVRAPFSQLWDINLWGSASTVFALLDIFGATTPNKTHLKIEFNDTRSVNLAPVTMKYGDGFLLQAFPPLTKLYIMLPHVMNVPRDDMPLLALLPPTLTEFVYDTSNKKVDMPAIAEITDSDVGSLVVEQPQLHKLHLIVWAPRLTVDSLVSVGERCRQIRDLWIGGKFELDKLAHIEEPLFPELLKLVIDCTAPIHAEESHMYATSYRTSYQHLLRHVTFTSIRNPGAPENVPLPEDSDSGDSVDEEEIWAEAQEYISDEQPVDDGRSEIIEAARKTLRTIMRHAPKLEELELIDKRGVNGAINTLWADTHRDG